METGTENKYVLTYSIFLLVFFLTYVTIPKVKKIIEEMGKHYSLTFYILPVYCS